MGNNLENEKETQKRLLECALIKLHFEEEYKESQKIKKEEVNDSMDYPVSAGFLFQKKIRRLDMVETLKGME